MVLKVIPFYPGRYFSQSVHHLEGHALSRSRAPGPPINSPNNSAPLHPSSRTAVLAQQAGAYEGEEHQNREHRTHAVPEVPRAFVRGPRSRQLARGRAWANAILRRSLEEGEKLPRTT